MAKCKINWIHHSPGRPEKFASNSEITLFLNSEGILAAYPYFQEGLEVYTQPIETVAHVQKSWFAISYQDGMLCLLDISPAGYSVLHSMKLASPMLNILYSQDRIFMADERTLYLTSCEFSYCFDIFSADRIVQLAPFGTQDVLVSTLSKSFIIRDEGVTQIGKKERNGVFGACQIKDRIYASRPNGNVWEATPEGIVKSTVNYKTLQGAKVKFGLLYSWTDQFIVSVSDESLIVIDVQANNIFYKEDNVTVYFNVSEQKLYVLRESIYYAQLQTSIDIFNSLCQEPQLDQAVEYVLADPTIQFLEYLAPLCERILVRGEPIQAYDGFVQLVEKLESRQELELPVAEFESEPKIDPDFELFGIKLQGSGDKVAGEVSREHFVLMKWALKRLRGLHPPKPRDHSLVVEFYSNKSYLYMHIRNWLLDLIWRTSQELNYIVRFKQVARNSLDYTRFHDLFLKECTLLTAIQNIL